MSKYQGSEAHKKNMSEANKASASSRKRKRLEKEKEYSLSPKPCALKSCPHSIPYKLRKRNKFCSKSCSAKENNMGRSLSGETKRKISTSVKKAFSSPSFKQSEIMKGRSGKNLNGLYQKNCSWCGGCFESVQRRRQTCSRVCARALSRRNVIPEEESSRAKKAMEKQMKEGRWKGWSGRSERSFPEKWVEKQLRLMGICSFDTEKQVSRFSLDFAFPDINLALEVDGKQHQYPKQRAHDIKRDAFLESQGWTVFRMPWKSVKTPAGLAHMESQIEKFVAVWKERSEAQA